MMLAKCEVSRTQQGRSFDRGLLRALSLLGSCVLFVVACAAGVQGGDGPASGPSPLDKLDPAQIPAENRFDKQPTELVAVLGKRDDSGSYNSVAFSPDGKVLSSCRNNVVVLWDAGAARELAVLRGHTHPVRSVAFAPDGKMLASGAGEAGKKGEIRFWDLGGEQPRFKTELAGHTDGVLSVAFSPDGKTLASASFDKTVRLWDLSGERPTEKVKLPAGPSNYLSVAFSPDGKMLATTDALWNLGAEKPEKRAALYSSVYRGSGGSAVAFAPNGKRLAVGAGNDRAVLVWNLGGDKLKEPVELKDAGFPVLSVAMAPDSRRLASSDGDGRVFLWDADGKKLQEWRLTRLAVMSLAFAPDGRHLAAANEKGLVFILRLPK
jgi:WD40 repeat protein